MRLFLVRFWLCLPLFMASIPGQGQTPAESRIYTVGITPQYEARRLFEIWRPILDAVEKETGLTLSLRGGPTINDFEQQYLGGQLDFAYVNSYLVGVRNPKGYLPLVRDHGTRLQGVLVVNKGSPIRSARELDGKVVAFPAPDAIAGCLLIRAQLESEFGVRIVPRFVGSHDSSFLNAAVGTADAAGGVAGTLERQPDGVRSALRVLLATREVAALPFVANPAVPEKVRAQVQAAFLKLGTTEAGRALLSRVPIRQVGVATMADYEPLRRMGLDRYVDR